MAQADKDAKSIREEAQKQAGVIIENAKQEAQEEKRRQLEAMHDQVMELSVAWPAASSSAKSSPKTIRS